MRWKLLVISLVGLSLAACETPTEVTGSASGKGTVANIGRSQSSAPQAMIASRAVPMGPRRGSQEDLVTNVGDRVFFALDSFELEADALAMLEKQAAWLKQNPGISVWVEGHADERGTREYNLALGERRASAIRDYLVALDIQPNRMQTRSYGMERPVDPRSAKEAWDKNRRGVMVVR